MPHLSALLAAALLLAEGLPFPPPRQAGVTEKTKCDTGSVQAVEPPGTLRVTTPAGVITYRAGPEVQVFGADGRPVGGITILSPGQKVRVYYHVEDGARVVEIDLE